LLRDRLVDMKEVRFLAVLIIAVGRHTDSWIHKLTPEGVGGSSGTCMPSVGSVRNVSFRCFAR